MAANNKLVGDRYFVNKMIESYLVSLSNNALHSKLDKIAFDFSDYELLVWVEIKEGDEESENILYDIEAKINSSYHDKGYDVVTTIVEDTDNLKIPSHYKLLESQ